ncbi:MAG: PKD domain-containing protein [Methanomicrobiales archaeon]
MNSQKKLLLLALLVIGFLLLQPVSAAESYTASFSPGTSSTAFISGYASPNTGFLPLTVHFTDTSRYPLRSWFWDFGDGSFSYEKNPTHVYTQMGSFQVTLKQRNSYSTPTKIATITVTLHPNPTPTFPTPPIANFTYSGNPPSQFTDRSTGNPTTWNWNFGDGTYSSLQNPYHTYENCGIYTITLTVCNAGGCTTSSAAINIPCQGSPVADFDANPSSGCAPFAVCFIEKSTGNPTTWNWSFGDGTYSSLQNPCHTYANPGNYPVSLTVSNTAGANTKFIDNFITVIDCNVTIPIYKIRTWSQDGEFPAANVDVWYKKANIIPLNPTITSSFVWDSDEHYLGNTGPSGVLSGVLLPDNWIVIRTRTPDYSKGCWVVGGWYYTANTIANVNEIHSNPCHEININLNNRHEWSNLIPVTPTILPTFVPTVTPSVTITIPSPWPSV